MNPSERFFTKLRKLTVHLETESKSLLQTCQNLRDDDEDEESGAQALYQLHSEVRALKRQVQSQVATHDATSTELRGFIKRCLVLKQRTTEDLDRLKKHYEKYGYRPRNGRQGNTETKHMKEIDDQAERDAAQEDEDMGLEVCEDAQQTETPEKMPPPIDQLRTPKLSDFGLSALHFQRVLGETEQPISASPVPVVALSPPPATFVMNLQSPQPKTPKCSLRMEEDAPTPRLEDFGISENTMCWNNDFTMDLFNRKPSKPSSERAENNKKASNVFSTPSSVPNKVVVANESLESPELPVFCTPGFKIEKHHISSSPPLNGMKDLDTPPHPSNCPSTPVLPVFETPFVSKLIKKEDRQEEGERHRGSQKSSFHLSDISNTNKESSFDPPEMPRVLCYPDEVIPEMPTLESLFGSSLAFKKGSGESLSGINLDTSNGLDPKQPPVPIPDNSFNQDWCLSTPKVRVTFPIEPGTPEMPDMSSVTQDILKLVAQCKS